MARFPAAKPILDAATHWRDRCLLGQGSVFTDQALWTRENVQALVQHYANNPDEGEGSFFSKFKHQIGPASPDAKKLAAEMLWVMYLIVGSGAMGADTKREQIRRVWGWSGDSLPEDHPLLGSVLGRGVVHTGTGYHTNRWREVLFFVRFMEQWHDLDPDRRTALLGDAWEFQRWLDGFEFTTGRQLRHILLFYLFPDEFERVASVSHKREIVKHFRAEYGLPKGEVDYSDSGQLDREIFLIRERVREKYGEQADEMDFYLDPLASVWRGDDDPPAFDDDALEHAKALFLRRFPGFEGFESPPAQYLDDERAYKAELVRRWRPLADDLPDPGDLSSVHATQVVDKIVHLLSSSLESIGQPQNLISWRYTNFLRELDGPEKVTFVRALIALVRGEEASTNRAGAFVQTMWPIMESHGATGYAASRSVPTLFLFLDDPENEIFVRTDLFDSFSNRLTGDRLFRNKRLDGREYARVLGFAHAIKAALGKMGWPPRDMIDVQSFMWTVEQEWAADAKIADVRDDKVPGVTDEVDAHGASFLALRQTLLDAGLYFPAELVANYVLALQTKRFVILTGISGTGKTQLAKQVGAHFAPRRGGDPEEPLVVAVRPDWTDPRGLIGYYNPITESYVPTEFLRLLLRARKEEDQARLDDRPAQPFFVILDEMNLARVEHYFADFLSALESGSELTLHHGAASDDADDTHDAIPPTLRIPRNVFFTGTVNVDETTHMFSPKVLDRAFTLELTEVDLDGWTTSGATPDADAPGLDLPAMHPRLRYEFAPGAEDWDAFGGLLDGILRQTVVNLNEALTDSGYHFAYRVAGEIARFVRLAHAQGANTPDDLWMALDLALLQKVLPKFHGTEQELQAPLEVVERLAQAGSGDAPPGGESEPSSQPPQAAPLPRCLAKVRRMQARLRARGFTAFIE